LCLFAAPLVPAQQMLRGAGENTDLRIIAGAPPGVVHRKAAAVQAFRQKDAGEPRVALQARTAELYAGS